MSHPAITPRDHGLLVRIDGWAHGGRSRAMLVKVLVTLLGPLVVLSGAAMTVLPGPGLVVIALGLGLLALEYEWARRVLGLMGRTLAKARHATLPQGGSRRRRALGVAAAGGCLVATTALTAAVTALVGAQTVI